MPAAIEDLIAKPWLRPLLLLPWFAYQGAVTGRNATFALGLRRARRLPVPVIGIGNITVGGTGKTPLVALVARLCTELGCRPAVIARGYRATADGRNDEAADSEVPVFCDPRRIRAGRAAIAAGHDCLIGDDLFQHRQLHRDLDIVCIDATRPWGRSDAGPGRLLPLGLLREPLANLRRADALVLTRSDQVDAPMRRRLHRALARHGQPVWTARHACAGFSDGAGTTVHPSPGTAVHLACGIGNPDAFVRSVADAGLSVAGTSVFPDHHHFTVADLERCLDQAGDRPLVITSKDAVKILPLLPDDQSGRCWVLRVRMDLPAAHLQALRALLTSRLARRGMDGLPASGSIMDDRPSSGPR